MIRLLIVEDQEIVRRGLRVLLATQPDLEIVGEAENGQEAIDVVSALADTAELPDVVLMDIKMPVVGGVEATQAILKQFPQIKVIVLTTFEDNEFVSQALSCGAKGYLLKDTPVEELSDAIRSICKGYTQFGPGILEGLVSDTALPSQNASEKAAPKELPPGFSSLTAKEKEVLGLIAQGANNKEIAAALFVSEGTVRNHISHILGRLNVRDRTQAAILSNDFLPYLIGDKATAL